jgi:hypothetical protein
MTTSNQIVTKNIDDALYIPLEAVHANDSVSFVYSLKGKRQIVILGEQNENFIIVESGLLENDEVYLSVPEKPERQPFAGLELVPEIKKRNEEKKQQIEAEKAKNQMQKGSVSQMGGIPIPGGQGIVVVSEGPKVETVSTDTTKRKEDKPKRQGKRDGTGKNAKNQ